MAAHSPKSPTNPEGYDIDSLKLLIEQGPLDAGALHSKSSLVELVRRGYAVYILVKGQSNYVAATEAGRDMFCRHYEANDIRTALNKRADLTRRGLK